MWRRGRLSVDIDVNYVGAIEKEQMDAERPSLEDRIERLMLHGASRPSTLAACPWIEASSSNSHAENGVRGKSISSGKLCPSAAASVSPIALFEGAAVTSFDGRC